MTIERPIYLFHYGAYEPLWDRPGMFQCGPRMMHGNKSVHVSVPTITSLRDALQARFLSQEGVLVHFTDPFFMRSAPLKGLRQWMGPRLLACGDLHHGDAPVKTLSAYMAKEFHDAVLLTFNPSLIDEVRKFVSVPVHCHPPSFFRYPERERHDIINPTLTHVGSLSHHHKNRRDIVNQLLLRQNIPFEHHTTQTSAEAADIYSRSAIVLNIPLNNDLNHRFFEIMSAGAPQIVFAAQELLGDIQFMKHRDDVRWVKSIDELEQVCLELLRDPIFCLRKVNPPPKVNLTRLIYDCFNKI